MTGERGSRYRKYIRILRQGGVSVCDPDPGMSVPLNLVGDVAVPWSYCVTVEGVPQCTV